MFKIMGKMPYYGNIQLKTKVTKECLKWYSQRTTAHPGNGRFLWALGSGVAIATGVAASLLFHYRPLGIEEAGCKKKDKRQTNEFPDGLERRGDRLSRLEEAVKKSRELLQRAKVEVGSPGIVAAVGVDGKLLWTEGLGYADLENRLPCMSDSVHRIASISKSFTMAAVAKLLEEGKLDLDKPVQFYVPEFPEKEVDGEQVDMTTRQLVSHLAGIRHYGRDYIKKMKESDKDNTTENNKSKDSKLKEKSHSVDDQTQATAESVKRKKAESDDCEEKEFYISKNYSSVVDALEIFKDDPLMHKPGSKFCYTTHGWTLVSAIVDAAADQDFLAYMQTIFKDLGMFHTVPDKAQPLIYNRARGYSYNKRGKLVNTPAVNLSSKWAGGGFLSDVRDLIQFGNSMLYSYQYTESHKDAGYLPGYLKPETVKTIWASVPGTKCSWEPDGFYAMGWGVLEKGEHKGFCPEKHQLVSHTGAAVGASSVLLIVPQESDLPNRSRQVKNDGTLEGGVQDRRLQVGQSEPEKVLLHEISSLPQGVVVAIIVNLENVSLYKTAVQIAKIFQEVDC